MLYSFIKNYEDFQQLFYLNGRPINRILLDFWKYQHTKTKKYSRISSLDELYSNVLEALAKKSNYFYSNKILIPFSVNGDFGKCFYTGMYYGSCDVCIGTNNPKCVRVRNSRGLSVDIKAGKLFMIIADALSLNIGKKALIYCSERFQSDWDSYVNRNIGVDLHVDDRFDIIYDGNQYASPFPSCMQNKNQWTFYRDSVNASAAYLTNTKGEITARCIIFNDIIDQNNNHYRYAERQYGVNELQKELLIHKLIKENLIDIYKSFGAGCGSITAITDKNSKNYSSYRFRINCNLLNGSRISYQDTFKFYYKNHNVATNYSDESLGRYFTLSTTNPTITWNY